MITLADGQSDWTTIYEMLAHDDFDPSRLMFESCVVGFTRDFVRKRVFIDIMAVVCFSFRYALTDTRIPVWNVITKKYGADRVSYADWYKNFKELILKTPYFDKWLKAYRLVSPERFDAFCKYALGTWSQTSSYRYEEYNPDLRTDELKAAWSDFVRDIINKTKKLLEKEKRDGNKQLRHNTRTPDVRKGEEIRS